MKAADWFKYHFCIALPPEPRGNLRESDFICPQAFGRNTWTDEEMPAAMKYLRIEIENDLTGHQDEAFAYLQSTNFDPGSVNVSLAKECIAIAEKLMARNKKPWIIGQWEVIFALATLKETMEWYQKYKSFTISIWPPSSGDYLQTRGLLMEARALAVMRGLKKP
ncbi:MAG: hypothetical protein ACD_5C00243G0001, partial [uncultured bacterium]